MGQEQEVSKVLSKTAKAILSEDGAKDLSKHFSQADQERLKDMDTAQVDQAVQQLRQAYKEKYQKELSFDAGAEVGSEQVFNSQFFRIGSGAGEAQPAGSQIPADPSSHSSPGASDVTTPGASGSVGGAGISGEVGASGASGRADASAQPGLSGQAGASGQTGAGETGLSGQAGASGQSGLSGQAGASDQTGLSGQSGLSGHGATDTSASGSLTDSARTAGASAGQNLTVTIPESHGMAEARLNLVREGSDWKIDLPENIDAQKLSQNLQRELQQAADMKDQWPQDATEAARAISHRAFIALSGDAQGATGAQGASGTLGGQDTTGAAGQTGSGQTGTPSGSDQSGGLSTPGAGSGASESGRTGLPQ